MPLNFEVYQSDAPDRDRRQLLLSRVRASQRVVLDCGMHPKEEGEAALPLLGTLGGKPVDALLLSHAHLDHIGSLPVLMRQQPRARVFMTEPTAAIGDALLHNSVNVMTRQREEVGRDLSALHPSRRRIGRPIAGSHCPLRPAFTVDGERSRGPA